MLSGTSLDAQTGLAPVSPLSVVSAGKRKIVVSYLGRVHFRWCEFQRLLVRFVRGVWVFHRFPLLFVVLFADCAPGVSDAGRGRNLPDGVAGAQTNPLGDRAVLTLSFGKLLLGAESLVALLR